MMSLRVIDSSFGSIRKTIRFSLSVPTARYSPEALRLLSDSSERINTLGRRRAPSYADSVRGEDRIPAARMSAAVPSARKRPAYADMEGWRIHDGGQPSSPVARFRDLCDRPLPGATP